MKRKSTNSWYPSKQRLVELALGAATDYAVNRWNRPNRPIAHANRPSSNPNRNNNAPVTVQNDVKVNKRKKRNPIKIKRELKFKRKVEKALKPSQSLFVYSEIYNTVSFNFPAIVAPVTNVSQTQGLPSANDGHLTMNSGSAVTGRDLTYMFGAYNSLSTSLNTNVSTGQMAPNPTVGLTMEWHLATMEISLTNNSVGATPMLYDVYECVAAKDISDPLYGYPRAAWAYQLQINLNVASSGFVQPLTTYNGQTPYDCPGFGKYWKVVKKTRVYLGPATTTELKVYSKIKRLRYDKTSGLYAIKGRTRGVIIVGGVGDNAGGTAGSACGRFTVQKTWHFRYTNGNNELQNRNANNCQFFP